ncbi:MAG: thermonuclease family protein [Lachnospiraceae bacterium]|nr:thermonuclease family protein [Lachnospiraceae bacterium]
MAAIMKSFRKKLNILLVIAAAVVFVLAAGHYVNSWQAAEDARHSAENAGSGELKAVTVRSVVDGDTLLLTDDTKVRLLGIDAPESVHQDKKRNSVYGDMASEHMHELVHGGDRIWILWPAAGSVSGEDAAGVTGQAPGQEAARESDNYGRHLRLVWTARPDLTDGLTEAILRESLNARMLQDGYAVTYIMEEGEPYESLFYTIRKEAENAGKGLWSEDGWRAYAALNYFGE